MKTRPGKAAEATFTIRLALCVVLSTLLAGNVVGLVHMAATRHVRCPEHGLLSHVESSHGASVLSPSAPQHPGDVTASTNQQKPVEGGHRHHHCAVAGVCRQQVAPTPQVVSGEVAPVLAAPEPVPLLPALPRAVAVYAVAPKQSPPFA